MSAENTLKLYNMDKKYLGKGKQGKFDILNCSICVTDIPKDAIFTYEGKKYLKFCVGKMKETDKYGKTHTIWLDEFKPEKQEMPF